MNGDISRIPIQSLGAVVSLTDILPELPLPAPLQSGSSPSSLLWDSQFSESCSDLLRDQSDYLTGALGEALDSACTDTIDFKDGFANDSVDLNLLPSLLTNVLFHNHALFQHKRGFFGLPQFTSNTISTPTTGVAWRQLRVDTDTCQTLPDIHTSYDAVDEPNCCLSKRKKKRKKRKHKHRDLNGGSGGDTSETGGESNATTPATYDATTPSRQIDDAVSSPVPTYGVVADATKLSLKIFKRPIIEAALQSHLSNDTIVTSEPTKKEKKKKKRSRERDQEHKSRHERKLKAVSETPILTSFSETTGVSLSLTGSITTPVSTMPCCSIPTSSLSSELQANGDAALDATPTKLPCDFDLTSQTVVPNPSDLSFISSDSLFDHLGSSHMSYREPPSLSTSSLPSIPTSSADISHSNKTNPELLTSATPSDSSLPTDLSNHAFVSQSTLFDGILNDVDPSMSFMDSTAIPTSDLTSCSGPPTSAVSTASSVCNIMDYASHYLQNEMLSVSLCDGFPMLGLSSTTSSDDALASRSNNLLPSPHPFHSSFMIASHLADSLPVGPHTQAVHESEFGLSTGILHPVHYASAPDSSPSTAFVNNFDIAGLTSEAAAAAAGAHHHVPMGLASYLATPGQTFIQSAQSQTTTHRTAIRTDPTVGVSSGARASQSSLWKRKATDPSRRRKRRKNELEDLQQWTVNYPSVNATSEKAVTGDERTWDDAIGNYSQVLAERAKRRKRMARQPGKMDSDYVFENDKDYPNGDESDTNDAQGDPHHTIDLTNDTESDTTQMNASSRGLRSGAAQRSYVGMDDEEEDRVGVASVAGTDSSASARRRKRVDDDEPFEVRLKEPVEARFPHLIRKSSESTRKRRERVGFGIVSGEHTPNKRSTVNPSFGTETGSLKRFLHRLQNVLESIEDCDLLQNINSSESNAQNDPEVASRRTATDDTVPPEAFIAPDDLTELCRDAAKLNSTRIANKIPIDQLVKFMTLLLINIRDGASVIATLRPDEEADEHDNRLWRELAMERVMRSVNAGLASLLLMTANDMPREVYVEDVIERTVQTVRFQLVNCIYPEFDPAYRVVNMAKENQSSIKSRRARERDVQKPRAILHLYHKLVETVSNLAKLVKMQRLTDSLVLALSSVGVSVFFVENVTELQLAALELVTAIFEHYEPHRKLVMEEILASLARLPSSKRNLRSYRLNSEDNIQMFTALALLLVQSVIVLPAQPDAKSGSTGSTLATTTEEQTINGRASHSSEERIKTDDEVLVINSYHNALRTAHTFLLVFLRKSTVKGEDDYRLIFENFVNDLLSAVNKPEWPAAEVMLSLLGSLLVQQFNNKSLDQTIRVASVDYLGTVASILRRDAVTSQLKENDIDVVIRDLLDGSHSEEEEEEDDDNEEEEEGIVKDVKTDGLTNGPLPNNKLKEEEVTEHESDTSIKSEEVTPSKQRTKTEDSVCPTENGLVTRLADVRSKSKPSRRDQAVDPITQLDRVQALRDAILDYLAAENTSPTSVYARKFYLAQWLNDCTKETEKAQQAVLERKNEGILNGGIVLRKSSAKLSASDRELVLSIAERRRQHILFKIREPPDTWRQRRKFWTTPIVRPLTGRRADALIQAEAPETPLVFHGTLDYEDACLVCRYLASLRPFFQSFDVYLSQICKLLSESSVPVRTKALRCLSAVVEADPNILAGVDIERAVHARLLDTSTSVREAAVDLLGRFLGRKPELTAQYYPMLAERIRDKGVSVRKRVIRILRDICLEQPDFPRIAEICVLMIRRVNDEEGIKKLVNEVFQTMWFSPVRDKETVRLFHKVMNITDVVAASKDTGYEWFEQFLRSLVKKEEVEKVKSAERACKQIVDCLVQHIMRLEEISGQNNQRLVACLATLHLLTKIRPDLMVQYAMVLQTYLRCNETSDPHVLHYVARILEVTVPLMEHPSETFVAQLEEDMVRLTLRHGKMVLESCVACLGSVVNRVSKNYSLARDCFTRLFNALQRHRNDLMISEASDQRNSSHTVRPLILRALFTVGLLCKHFDANVFQCSANTNVRDQVFDLLMFFIEEVKTDLEMRKKALAGLGFLCTRHHELLCGPRLREFYQHLLQSESIHPAFVEHTGDRSKLPSSADPQLELKCIVLENLLSFFLDEEKRMLDADSKWKSRQHQESLKEMGDLASGMGSFVAQTYLKDTLETFFSPFAAVRLTALSVVSTILRQGLIHPVQTVPYLIAMQTDLDANVRTKADAQLQEIDHKFPGFLGMRAIQGVSFSYRLQFVLYPEISQLVTQKSKSSSVCLVSPPDSTTTGRKSDPSHPTRRSTRRKCYNATSSDAETGLLDECIKSTTKVNDESSDTILPLTDCAENVFDCIRGTRDPLSEVPNALNSNLYSMLRVNRGQWRSLLSGLIALFDDSQASIQHVHLSQLIYLADNLAHFPYQCNEEPLFVIHHIDLMVSMSGSGVLQSVRETLFPELKPALEAALTAQAEAEMKNRALTEMQLRTELQALQAASSQALARSDHAAVEHHGDQIQMTLHKLSSLLSTNPPHVNAGCTSTMNELRSAALVGRDGIPHVDLGPLEEEEEDAEALLRRLNAARSTALPIMRDAIRSSHACVLLLTLKQYLKDVYSITDAKIQRYSPTDPAKMWERALTRRAGVRFHPGPCLQTAALELRKLVQRYSVYECNSKPDGTKHPSLEWPPVLDRTNDASGEECYAREMQSLIQNYLEFRKLILTIDPPGEDELAAADETINPSAVSAPLIGVSATVEQNPSQATRLRPTRTLVPQSHNKSSDEENDSEDSNAGGASRLMLAQSAPSRRRKPGTSARSTTATTTAGRTAVVRSCRRKRKRKRRYAIHGSSSGDESESAEESEQSDPDF